MKNTRIMCNNPFRSGVWMLSLLIPEICCAQEQYSPPTRFGLEEIVVMAKHNSTASLQAATTKENKYWLWKTFKSNYRPQFTLDGQLPNFSRTNIPVTQPDGTVEFRSIANDNSQLNLGIVQNIGFSGGQISLKSNLFRFRDFDRQQTRYNGNPLILGFNQPLFSFNALSWDKKIEPLRYEESIKKYKEDIEYVSRTASSLFFNLLIAQINHDIASKNKANNDTLYKIGEVKYDLGKLSRDELLQLKLSTLNAGKSLAQAQLNAESAAFELKSYIGFKDSATIELILPENLPEYEIDIQTAIREARINKQQTIAYKRSLLEADREIAKARGDNGLNAALFGTFGLTNRSADIGGIYTDPKDQQTVNIGFRIPVLDWGRSASRIKTAEVNKKLVEYTIAQEEVNFDQQIFSQVKQFSMIRAQMQGNVEADKTAQERYEISRNRYMLGDISITNLNIALQEKDQSRRDYILALKNFWDAYFNIRVLTLYDFEKKRKIEN